MGEGRWGRPLAALALAAGRYLVTGGARSGRKMGDGRWGRVFCTILLSRGATALDSLGCKPQDRSTPIPPSAPLQRGRPSPLQVSLRPDRADTSCRRLGGSRLMTGNPDEKCGCPLTLRPVGRRAAPEQWRRGVGGTPTRL
jgi:hypothetical protein